MPHPILIYRRSLNSTTWHFCRNCSFWPRLNFEQYVHVPKEGALCGECKVHRAAGICEAPMSTKPLAPLPKAGAGSHGPFT